MSQTWQEKFIVANGIKLHYVTQGEGQLLIFLHGFPEFWYSWRWQIPEFAADYRVVALDLRGYNLSEKPSTGEGPFAPTAYAVPELVEDIKEVISGLGYEECYLVGHDWGGVVAWTFAAIYPHLLRKLTVMNMPHPARFKAGLGNLQQLRKSWYIFVFQLPWLAELIFRASNYELITQTLRRTSNPDTFTTEDLEAYKQAIARPGALTAALNYYRNVFYPGFLPSSWKDWPRLEVPTLLLWGEQDVFLGKELTYNTEAYVEDLQVRYLSNAGHWIQQEEPELVNRYLREFLS